MLLHLLMWVEEFHKPSPSHHRFLQLVCLPFPVMGGKNGIVLPTLSPISIDTKWDDHNFPILMFHIQNG